jgi:hypothetical protein
MAPLGFMYTAGHIIYHSLLALVAGNMHNVKSILGVHVINTGA